MHARQLESAKLEEELRKRKEVEEASLHLRNIQNQNIMTHDISVSKRSYGASRIVTHGSPTSHVTTTHVTTTHSGDEGLTFEWGKLLSWMTNERNAMNFKSECLNMDANQDGLLHYDLTHNALEKAGFKIAHSTLEKIFHALQATEVHPTLGTSVFYNELHDAPFKREEYCTKGIIHVRAATVYHARDAAVSANWKELYHWLDHHHNRDNFNAECRRMDANQDGLLHVDLVNAAFKTCDCPISAEHLNEIYNALGSEAEHSALGHSVRYTDLVEAKGKRSKKCFQGAIAHKLKKDKHFATIVSNKIFY